MSTRFTNVKLQGALQLILDFERPDGDIASTQLDRLGKCGTKTSAECAHWHSYAIQCLRWYR